MTPRAKAAVAVVAITLGVGFLAWRLLRGDVAGTPAIAAPRVAPAPVARAPSTDAASPASRATVEPPRRRRLGVVRA
jgi:hypothetical protein